MEGWGGTAGPYCEPETAAAPGTSIRDVAAASPFEGKLEPEARSQRTPEQAALTSIAVSLKRIADTLDGTTAGICVSQTIFAGRN
jgi:hypothetical protein